MQTTSPTKLAAEAGISVPYASQLLTGKRTPSLKLALSIYATTGIRFGPLANASADQIAAVAAMAAGKSDDVVAHDGADTSTNVESAPGKISEISTPQEQVA